MKKTWISKKREREKSLLLSMIKIYCKSHRHTVNTRELCADCKQVLSYSFAKIDQCPFMETKTFCSSCSVHCYDDEMQRAIRRIMRYAGPRMLFRRPVVAIQHMFSIKRRKRKSC